jgi:hypothetical protein
MHNRTQKVFIPLFIELSPAVVLFGCGYIHKCTSHVIKERGKNKSRIAAEVLYYHVKYAMSIVVV